MVTTGDEGGGPRTFSGLRTVLGYVAVVGCVPYLVLKIVWLCGVPVGLGGGELLEDPVVEVLNWITGGLELAAICVGLALAQRWGMRLPAWMLVLPVWVGMGLLVPRILVMPLSVLTAPASAGDGGREASPVEVWVMVMVSLCFVLQGVCLAGAFVLYARQRWGGLLLSGVGSGSPGVTGPFQAVVAYGTAVLFVPALVLRVVGAMGTPGADRAFAGVEAGMDVLWAVMAVAGLVVLVTGRFGGGLRVGVALGAAWLGSGSLFAWGSLNVFSALAVNPAIVASVSPVLRVSLFVMVALALIVALTAAFALVEREAAYRR
jgi:hypothetical protein